MVTAAQRGGRVSSITLEPTLAGTITLKNPWAPAAAKIFRGAATELLTGDTLTISTKPGVAIRLTPE
jgi:hypothetical protein